MSVISGLKKLKDFIYGRNSTCYLCGNEVFGGEYFCADCKDGLPYNTLFCERCGRKVLQKVLRGLPLSSARLLKKPVPYLFTGTAREAVLRFKNGERWFAKGFIEEGMPVIERDLADFDFVSFVPMSERGLRSRGYNQSELLAREIADRTGKPMKDLFVKERDTAEQKSLKKSERQKNLRGSFRLHRRAEVKGRTVLLADDALTTGATAESLCKLLSGAVQKRFISLPPHVFYGRNVENGK